MTTVEPRIYVASLSAYNAGTLHGEWINATQEPDEIAVEVQAMLAKCPENNRHGYPSEEWAIHDHEGLGEISEWESFEDVSKIAQAAEKHGEAFLVFLDDRGDLEDALENFEEAYAGQWETGRAFAENWIDEGMLGEIPESLQYFIDVDAVWSSLSDDYFISDSGHVFRRNV